MKRYIMDVYEEEHIFLFVGKFKDYEICLSLAHGMFYKIIYPTLPIHFIHNILCRSVQYKYNLQNSYVH